MARDNDRTLVQGVSTLYWHVANAVLPGTYSGLLINHGAIAILLATVLSQKTCELEFLLAETKGS